MNLREGGRKRGEEASLGGRGEGGGAGEEGGRRRGEGGGGGGGRRRRGQREEGKEGEGREEEEEEEEEEKEGGSPPPSKQGLAKVPAWIGSRLPLSSQSRGATAALTPTGAFQAVHPPPGTPVPPGRSLPLSDGPTAQPPLVPHRPVRKHADPCSYQAPDADTHGYTRVVPQHTR